ncbi:MAG: hypothetical protein V3R93_05105, partial [Candidatus Hydrothermarchaeaceae archaeon]
MIVFIAMGEGTGAGDGVAGGGVVITGGRVTGAAGTGVVVCGAKVSTSTSFSSTYPEPSFPVIAKYENPGVVAVKYA